MLPLINILFDFYSIKLRDSRRILHAAHTAGRADGRRAEGQTDGLTGGLMDGRAGGQACTLTFISSYIYDDTKIRKHSYFTKYLHKT